MSVQRRPTESRKKWECVSNCAKGIGTSFYLTGRVKSRLCEFTTQGSKTSEEVKYWVSVMFVPQTHENYTHT